MGEDLFGVVVFYMRFESGIDSEEDGIMAPCVSLGH